MYTKPKYSDLVLPASSNHPHSQKMAAFNSMIHRLHQIPRSKEDFERELNTIKHIANKMDLIEVFSEKYEENIMTTIIRIIMLIKKVNKNQCSYHLIVLEKIAKQIQQR